MIDWKYPENGDNPLLTEGCEIIAEFYAFRDRRILHLRRVSTHWVAEHKPGAISTYPDEYITLIAWMPYIKPSPPEKPQDCPFCGSSMDPAFQLGVHSFWFECDNLACEFRTPMCPTRKEAIKALNSIEVKKK